MWINLTSSDVDLIKRALDQAALSKIFDWTKCRDLATRLESRQSAITCAYCGEKDAYSEWNYQQWQCAACGSWQDWPDEEDAA